MDSGQHSCSSIQLLIMLSLLTCTSAITLRQKAVMTKKGQQVLSGTTSHGQSANIHHVPAIKPNLSASALVSSASTLQRSFQRLQQQEMIGFDFINRQKAWFVFIYLFLRKGGCSRGCTCVNFDKCISFPQVSPCAFACGSDG